MVKVFGELRIEWLHSKIDVCAFDVIVFVKLWEE